MAKIAVLVTDNFEDAELTSPVKALKDQGHDVTLIETQAGKQITGKHGATATIDTTITDVKPEDFDGLLLPGGFYQMSSVPTTGSLTLSKHSC